MPRRRLRIGKREITLDARPDRLDLRDRAFLPTLGSLPPRWPSDPDARRWLPAYAAAKMVRDQGEDGACTGFGLAAVIDYLQFVAAFPAQGSTKLAAPPPSRRASPAMLYELARLYDEWPGEDYEGSSCRGALKGWHRHGVCREQLWSYQLDARGKRKFVRPTQDAKDRDNAARNWDVDALQCTIGVYYRVDARSVVDMQAAIHQTGALYCSGTVHEGWDVASSKRLDGHADLVAIEHVPSPADPGGHAFALVGYNEEGFVVQNSWGSSWGALGFALLPYADWVAHGDDAWVFTLGVPSAGVAIGERGGSSGRVARSPSYLIPPPEQTERDPAERAAGLITSSDAVDRRYRAVPEPFRPLDADTAYCHTVVLDRGFPVRNDVTAKDAAAAVKRVAYEHPSAWLARRNSNKLLIYAHGGLNSEAASIARIRTIAPYALASGIYPLYVTWRSGPLETLSDLVEELFAKLGFGVRGVRPATGWFDQITDRTDRMLEPLLRAPGGAAWQQMKLNAQRASDHAEGGCRALVQHLSALRKERPKLEIHLAGHSAGSIVLGALLSRMKEARLKAASLRLFAPACTLEFALARFKPAVDAGILDPKRWHIHNLSDKNERDDNVGPYRKSLLYLVSRSFEDVHKIPLLGLDRAFDPRLAQDRADDDAWSTSQKQTARAWLAFWKSLKVDATNRAAHVLSRDHVSTGAGSLHASHASFDNDIQLMGDMLGYITDPDHPVHVPIYKLEY